MIHKFNEFLNESGKENKSKACKMVLQAMDAVEEPKYEEIIKKVVKETGVDKDELEKEVSEYI